jgi:hypothetical protein
MRRLLMVVAVLFLMGAAGTALAQNKCDAGVAKAKGKKVACKCGVIAKGYAKGTAPDPTKLQKCTDKFTKACTKASGAGGCSAQSSNCAANEAEADMFVTDHCIGSPGGAFLE